MEFFWDRQNQFGSANYAFWQEGLAVTASHKLIYKSCMQLIINDDF